MDSALSQNNEYFTIILLNNVKILALSLSIYLGTYIVIYIVYKSYQTNKNNLIGESFYVLEKEAKVEVKKFSPLWDLIVGQTLITIGILSALFDIRGLVALLLLIPMCFNIESEMMVKMDAVLDQMFVHDRQLLTDLKKLEKLDIKGKN